MLLIWSALLLFKDSAKISITLSHQIRGIQLTRLDCNSGQWRKNLHNNKGLFLKWGEIILWNNLDRSSLEFFLLFSRNFYFLLYSGVFAHFWRRFFCCVLKNTIKCCLSFHCCFPFVDKLVIRFSANEVPLRRIKYQ